MRDGPRKGEEKALITRETFRNFSKLFRLVRKTTVVEIFSKFFQKIFFFFFFFFWKFVVRSTKLVLSRLNRASNKSDEDTEKGSRIKMIVLSFQITGARLGRRASSTRRWVITNIIIIIVFFVINVLLLRTVVENGVKIKLKFSLSRVMKTYSLVFPFYHNHLDRQHNRKLLNWENF